MNIDARYIVLLLLPVTLALTGVTPAEGAECLSCHGTHDIGGNGKGYLYIDPAKFEETTHSLVGCAACHDAVTGKHPADGIRPRRAACGECHAAVQQEYRTSLHGTKASCTDCHNPHRARPLAAVSGREINAQCARCHDTGKVVATHGRWLPQADLHLDALPCITCHTSSKNYVITLYIEKRINDALLQNGDFRPASYEELSRLAGGKGITALLDTDGDNRVSLAELKKFYKNAASDGLRLWGMMMPEVVTHDFQILDNRWDCTFCHASGPRAMQTSYVSFPDRNGRQVKLAVEKGAILDLLYGTPDFYMMGSTRSKPLSILGGMIVLGGLMVPVGHGTLRFLTRNNRKGERP